MKEKNTGVLSFEDQIVDLKSLTEEEKRAILKKIRDYGSPTGYATIDRPWKNFFDNEIYEFGNSETIYQDILKNNKKYLDTLALVYFGGKITYRELFENIDKTAKSLREYGIKKGDHVTICCVGIPEFVYSIYALAKIGAVANLISPYSDQKQISYNINACESDTLIVMDNYYSQINNAIKNSNIKQVIVIPSLNSTPLRFILKKKTLKLDYYNEIWWNHFIKDGKNQPIPDTFQYEEEYPLCIVYPNTKSNSSKAIVLSHDSFQYLAFSYDASVVLDRGKKVYQVIPPWELAGVNTSIHFPLHKGATILQDPRLDEKVFVKNIIRKGIDFTVAKTDMYQGFLDEKLIKGKKIVKFSNPIELKEPFEEDFKDKIEANLKKMGCESKIKVGYEQCECGAQVTCQSKYIKHPKNSFGIPIPGVNIGIFDDNFNELKYYERGNILVNTPCGMTGYYNDPLATYNYFHYDRSANKWNCTDYIGYLTSVGDLIIEGRKDDYTVINDEKIYNFDIENAIKSEYDILNCKCIGIGSDEVKELELNLIFSKTFSKIYENDSEKLGSRLRELQEIIFEKYNNINMVPEYFKVVCSLPNKFEEQIDSLDSETEGFIYIDKSYLNQKSLVKSKKMTFGA